MLEVQEFIWAEMSPHIEHYDRFNSKSGLLKKLVRFQKTHAESSIQYRQLQVAILCFQQSSIIDRCISSGSSIVLKSSADTEWFFEYASRSMHGGEGEACVFDLNALPYKKEGLFSTIHGIGPHDEVYVIHYDRLAAVGAVLAAGVAYYWARGRIR
jgi:hypothetical protein